MERHQRLNRTFYGIETREHQLRRCGLRVLIVPFMELKQNQFQKIVSKKKS